MNRMVRQAGIALAAVALSMTFFISAAPPASAIATGCNWGSEGSFSWAHCDGGTGQYQAWAQCKPRYWWVTNWYMSYGGWVNPGSISYANCDGNHQVASYGISYR